MYFTHSDAMEWRDSTAMAWHAITEETFLSTDFERAIVVLVDFYFGSGVKRVATRDFFTTAGLYYKGSLVEFPIRSRERSGIYYGVDQPSRLTLRLSNRDNTVDDTWYEIIAAEEIRGKPVRIQRWDNVNKFQFEMRGKVVSYRLGPIVEIELLVQDEETLEVLLPADVVTSDIFHESALDMGAPVNICFGYCRDVPLPNIKNDTGANHYDYLIGYGPIESLYIDIPNGFGVRRIEGGKGALVAEAEYTFYDGSQGTPYPGYAFIRFTVEQINFQGTPYALSADVKGLEIGGASAQRNFARVIEGLLSNATWGRGDSVDSRNFNTAAADLDSIGNFYCDGAITTQRQTRDILNDLLFVCRGTITRGSSGEWELDIDNTRSVDGYYGENDGYYNNCEITQYSAIPSEELLKTAIVRYRLRHGSRDYIYKLQIAVQSTGIEKIYELPFVYEHATAKKVLSYLYNRSVYADVIMHLRAGVEADVHELGDVISLDAPDKELSAVSFKIDKITRSMGEVSLICSGYNAAIFDDETIASPTEITELLTSTLGPQSWVTSEFPVVVIGTFTRSHKIKVRIDDVEYYVPLDAV